ncbi:MAG: 1,2-phenylacetyl-CoA epoxidase subunit PaaC [Flavobacteriales bacterium]
MNNEQLYNYILGIADNNLILGQRLGELCGHGPNLETDIALTNIALDLFGQTRSYYQFAATLSKNYKTEDEVAFLRPERAYRNVLLVEQPNTNFAYVIGRQYLFDVFHFLFLEKLLNSKNKTLSAIAAKAIKEVSYHKRFSGDWIKRLGDGTQESRTKMQEAIYNLWTFTNELFEMGTTENLALEHEIGVDLSILKENYYQEVSNLLKEATLTIPENSFFQTGGKDGVHSEHMGYLLADLQYMQRTYPNMNW